MDTLHAAGEERFLAALPGRMSYTGIETWAAQQPILPRSQWRPTSIAQFPAPILDQGSSSACVGFSFASCFRRAWEMSGQKDYPWNPYFTYGLINNGVDKGAIVGDAVDSAVKNGMAWIGNEADGDLPARVWFPQQLQQLSQVMHKASRFKVGQAYHLQGPNIFDQIASALQLGFATVSGIYVGKNFSRLDTYGVAPLPDVVAGGHALAHVGLVSLGGRWYIHTQNSWSGSWGQGGYCLLQEHAWDGMGDALAILAASEDPQDTTEPVVK